MKILKNGIKIRKVKLDCELKIIEIVYEKGISVEYITLTLEQAEEMKFINFENLIL